MLFADTDGYHIDGQRGEPGIGGADLSVYGSFTSRNGVDVLWYPDRKSILLGRRLAFQVAEADLGGKRSSVG